MAVNLSKCFAAFILALAAPVRAKLRQLLFTIKIMMEAKLAVLKSLVGRNDIIAQTYKTTMDQLQAFVKPIEDTLALIPLDTLNGCNEGVNVFGSIDDMYFEYKAKFEDVSYKFAQIGFASAYASMLEEKIEKEIEKLEQLIIYIDELAVKYVNVNTKIRNYSTGDSGTVSSVAGTSVTYTKDPEFGGGDQTLEAGKVGPIAG